MSELKLTVTDRAGKKQPEIIFAMKVLVVKLGVLIKSSEGASWDDDEDVQFFSSDSFKVEITGA